jgi:DNA-directed RNA polymerase subunit beta'
MAWTLYGPFVIGNLVKNGYQLEKAAEEVEKRTQAAKNVLLAEMKERPVLAKRDPVLHKFGVMAFKPQLVQGIHIKVAPLVVKPLGADYDGDTFTIHVPVTQEAIRDAWNMLPSKNLFSPLNKSVVFTPGQETIVGLYKMTKPRQDKPVMTFKNKQEALRAFHEGKIKINDRIAIEAI